MPRLSGTNTGAGPLGYSQIVQTNAHVVLYQEAVHEARIIQLDGRPHLPPSVRQWTGDSRGRWAGNTLVVDTINFSSKNNFMGSSDQLHLVERFTRVAPDRMDYQITIDDPTTWTKPWTAVIRLKQSTDRLYEYRVPRRQFRDPARHVRGRARQGAGSLAGAPIATGNRPAPGAIPPRRS